VTDTDNKVQKATDGSAGTTGRTVAVIGGGLAGITAAVKLFRQGYNVTLFERENMLGGNFSSNSQSNTDSDLDVYPHIIGDWYREFWYLLEKDFSFSREALFEKRDRIKMALIGQGKLENFRDVEYAELGTPTSLGNLVNNLTSSVLSIRDMFLFGYTYLDLISAPLPPREKHLKILDRLDVTGYLYSRPFMNEQIAELHDDILNVIWSMPSDTTSAQAYRDLLRYTLTFPRETPFAWLAKGPMYETVIKPITQKLSAALGKELKLNTEITGISIDRKTKRVTLAYKKGNGNDEVKFADENLLRDEVNLPAEVKLADEVKPFDYAIIATDSRAAKKLVFNAVGAGESLVSLSRQLARLREAEVGRIPVVYLYFTMDFVKKHLDGLKSLPRELIGFKNVSPHRKEEDDYAISILDLSQLWGNASLTKAGLPSATDDEHVLVLAASHSDAIAALGAAGEPDDDGKAQAHAMIRSLTGYLPFIESGNAWGDKNADVDWSRTRVIDNKRHLLFLNDAGSEGWRPAARVKNLKNVFLAGDYCRTDINMATVEAAVQSGVLAAQEVQRADRDDQLIPLQPHDVYGNDALLLVKLLAMPFAHALALTEMFDEARDDPFAAMAFPGTVILRSITFAADWVRSALWFWGGYLEPHQRSPTGGPSYLGVASHDRRLGILHLAANTALSVAREGPNLMPAIVDACWEGIESAWGRRHRQKSHQRRHAGGRVVSSEAQPPRTWPALEQLHWSGTQDFSVIGLSNAVIGLASIAIWAIRIAAEGEPTTNPAAGRPANVILETLKAAVNAGAQARHDRDMGFRVYPTVRPLS
jgi:hypothetical protein